MANILVVDDHEIIRCLLSEVLSKIGHNVTEACNAVEAIRLCDEHRYDLLILDYHLSDMNGLELVEHLKSKMRFILHTSDYDDNDVRQKALSAGALDVIAKISDVTVFRKNIELFLNM